MNYAEIYKDEICNGLGVGVSLYVSGCDMNPHCPGCFNSEAWDFDAGKPFTKEVEEEFLELADKSYIDRITILGGEPMAEKNHETVHQLCQSIRAKFGNKKKIWVYSGYTFEYLYKKPQAEILKIIDVLVDGPFVAAQKDLTLAFRGSSNQRIINIPETLTIGKVVELEE